MANSDWTAKLSYRRSNGEPRREDGPIRSGIIADS